MRNALLVAIFSCGAMSMNNDFPMMEKDLDIQGAHEFLFETQNIELTKDNYAQILNKAGNEKLSHINRLEASLEVKNELMDYTRLCVALLASQFANPTLRKPSL